MQRPTESAQRSCACPERQISIVILTNDRSADTRGMAQQILDQVLSHGKYG